MEMGANWSATNKKWAAENGQKSKKRKKDVQLERTSGEGTDSKCHNIPEYDEFKQGLLNADSVSNELLEANEKHQERKNDKSVASLSLIFLGFLFPDYIFLI